MKCHSCELLKFRNWEPVCESTNHVIPGGFLNYPRKKAKGKVGCTTPPFPKRAHGEADAISEAQSVGQALLNETTEGTLLFGRLSDDASEQGNS